MTARWPADKVPGAVRRSILAAFVETVEQLIPAADEHVIQPKLKRRGM